MTGRVKAGVLAGALALLAAACGSASGGPDAAVVATAPAGATGSTIGGGAAASSTTTTVVTDAASLAYRAAKPGELPGDGRAVVAGIRLPAGRRVAPNPSFTAGKASAEPVLWVTEGSVLDLTTLVLALQERFPTTGLWPVVLESLDGDGHRPWLDGEFDPSSSSNPATVDVGATLAAWWAGNFPAGDPAFRDVVQPFDHGFPGLADRVAREGAPDAVEELTASLRGYLGLVAVTRPADVPATIGFLGPTNYFADEGQLSAVLRSWEDRFGAVLLGLGFDTMVLAVRHPPVQTDDAERIAAEHVAVCPDIVLQNVQWQSIETYAKALRGQPAWACWWD